MNIKYGDDISEIIFNWCKELQNENVDLIQSYNKLKNNLPNLIKEKINTMSFIDEIKILFKRGEKANG